MSKNEFSLEIMYILLPKDYYVRATDILWGKSYLYLYRLSPEISFLNRIKSQLVSTQLTVPKSVQV